MRIALILMLSCVSGVAQETSTRGSQKPDFTDLYDADAPQVVIEVRFLTGPDEVFRRLKSEDLIRTAVQKPQRVLPTSSDEELQQQGGIQLVSATTVVRKNEPVFVRSLTDAQTQRLIQAVQGDQRSSVMFAPKVTMFDKQEAEIRDSTQRPFVVGLKKKGSAHQPEIEPVTEGICIGMRSTAKGQNVRLDLAIDISDIQDVQTKNAGPEGTMVQVPTVHTTDIQLSALVNAGKTLAISGFGRVREVREQRAVPVLGKVPYVSRMFKNTAVGREYEEMMILITPRVLSKSEMTQ